MYLNISHHFNKWNFIYTDYRGLVVETSDPSLKLSVEYNKLYSDIHVGLYKKNENFFIPVYFIHNVND